MAAPLPADAGFDVLFATWLAAQDDFGQLAHGLTDDEWRLPSDLPGWSLGDVVAHVAWLEDFLGGHVDDEHAPVWADLPHAQSDFARLVEKPVDLRRSWERERVLAELDEAVQRRRVLLESGARDPEEIIVGLLGPVPLSHNLRVRAFDSWVHEQDIRAVVGRPGHAESPGAQATAAHLLRGLPGLWADKAGAQPGETLELRVTGPIAFTACVGVSADGVGEVRAARDGVPTVALDMPWESYVGLATGRGTRSAWLERVSHTGSDERAHAVLDAFCITP